MIPASKASLAILFATLILFAAPSANSQTAAAATYGSFTVGGSSSSFYPVQFTNNVTAYGSGTGSNTSDLVIYRANAHENGTWFGTFNLVVSAHPSNWGHMFGQIEKLIYQTGRITPYEDPVGDIADGSLASGGNDIIVWLMGGATYHWRNRETTAGWSLTNGNALGGNITDSSGNTLLPIKSQSALILNAKNNFYVNALGLGTANNLTVGGNAGIGTTSPGAKLEVSGSVKLTAGSGGSIVFQDGTTQSTAYTGVICGGDYAESVDVAGDRTKYAPGDVLVIDPDISGQFLKSAEPYSTSVTGIYSTKPGTVGRRQASPKSDAEVPMAMVGIVPTKVSTENGPIRRGDLLVTSSTVGYAMKGTDRSKMFGAVIGKALDNLDSGKGLIEVVVTLQ